MNLFAAIQNYFRDWLKETGGIGAYTTFTIDLSKAHDNERYTFTGDQVIVTGCDNPVSIKLNDVRNDAIDLDVIKQVNSPFNEFYITNAVSSGSLKILCGSEGVFQCDPSLRIMSGKYGSQFKPVAIDANGNLISIIRDPVSLNYAAVDASGYFTNIMKGLEGANLRTIAVDADGNIVGVFKGDYGGTLKTVAVDTEGRIQAVLTDPEDVFGNPHHMGASELASRLGSIRTFDRRGTTYWMDDFESSTLKWHSSTMLAGGSGALSTDTARNGDNSFKMVTDNTIHRGWQLVKRFATPKSDNVGVEINFSSASDIWELAIELTMYSGAYKYPAWITWTESNNTLKYYDSAGAYQTISDNVHHFQDEHLFYPIKLVADFNNHKYLRLIHGETEFDLSAHDLKSSVSATHAWLVLNVNFVTKENVAKTCYLDDIIITQNEPD
jgi:hypothetical protein